MKNARLWGCRGGACVINEDLYTFSTRVWIGWAGPTEEFWRKETAGGSRVGNGTCSETRLAARRQRVERAALHRSEQYECISVVVMS